MTICGATATSPISLLRWEMFGDPSDIQAIDQAG